MEKHAAASSLFLLNSQFFILNSRESAMERETGLEPATNSLEGCDSTN